MKQDICIIKEDNLVIKGEIRKLNHSLLKQEIRWNSILLESIDNSEERVKGIDETNMRKLPTKDKQNNYVNVESPRRPTAPPLSQE